MAIENLIIIGESINDSVPSTRKLFEADDIEGIKGLARLQDELGAVYIDVNVGSRPAEFLADMVKQVQSVTAKPISIDSPDPEMVAAALKVYDAERAGGVPPLLNSISPLRYEMFDLQRIRPFRPVLLISERQENGVGIPNHTAEETFQTACEMLDRAHAVGLTNEQVIFDPALAPLATDSEGNIHRLMGALRLMHDDARFAGTHVSVGLTNLTVMLPSKRANGMPVKSALESAFLTRAMPLGLDMVIGSVKRNHTLLPEDDDAMVCFDDILTLSGFDVLMRVQEFYA